MISLIFSLVTFALSVSAPSPSPSPNPTPATAAAAAAKQCYGCCPCPIGMKSW